MLLPYAGGYLSNGKEANVYDGMLYGLVKYLPEEEYV